MKRFRSPLLLGAIILFFALACSLHAEEIAEVYAMSGTASVKGEAGSSWSPLSKGQRLHVNDLVKVGPNSRVGIRFDDGKLIRLRENSQLRLATEKKRTAGGVNLLEGALHLFSRSRSDLRTIDTPEVSAAIRGTEVVATSKNGKTTVSVFDGEVRLENSKGFLRVQSGEQAETKKGSAPQRLLLAKPLDQVEWALFFPTIFSRSEYPSIEKRKSLAHVLEHAKNREFDQALLHYQGRSLRDEEKLLKGTVEMQLGLAERARKTLSSIKSDELTAATSARLGILALVRNETDEANRLYDTALKSSNASPATALLGTLLSSSQGDIAGAEDLLNDAIRQFPDEPVLLARKAELLLGQGKTAEGLEVAVDAHKLAPNDPMALSILGFAHLAREEGEAAEMAFTNAASTDPDLPVVHFGLGLSKIAQGNLREGRDELEKAVHLDTARSMYRSYLGKAFFEEKREDATEKEYELAIERDPNDPTPYLYRAFNRLAQNQLVAALSDVEDSIERNDARAVYRSRSLLDQDLAVRTTSLAEVFRQLGFREIARIEALKSLSSDYSNYSAHRLLGEVLEGDYFADAKFSQQLISELLSPLSFNTFQSFDGFSSEAGLNDYAALFNQPGHRTKINVGSSNVNDTHSIGLVQTGREGIAGYLASYGARNVQASKLREHRGRIAVQLQPSVDHRFLIQGSISALDDTTDGEDLERTDVEGSIGTFHRLSNETELITRVEYFGRDTDLDEGLVTDFATETLILDTGTVIFPDFDIDLDQVTEEKIDSVRGNVQVIHSNEDFSFVGGIEHLYTDGRADEESTIISDSLGIFDGLERARDSDGNYDTTTFSTYGYATVHVNDWLDLTGGLSFRDVELPEFDVLAPFVSGERSQDRFLPKAGFTILPSDNVTVRGAYFRNLGSSSVNDIGTIEPTVVGSFIQLLGDLPGALSENYGIGVDYRNPKSIYSGIEYIYRDLSRDGVTLTTDFVTDATTLSDTFSFSSSTREETEREHLIRAYLYAVLSDEVAGLVEYRRDDLDAIDISEENEIDRVRTGLRYFSDALWFIFADLDWYNQDLRGVAGFADGDDEFWIANLGAGFRFPERKGLFQIQIVNLLDESFTYASRSRFTDPPKEIGFLANVSFNFS